MDTTSLLAIVWPVIVLQLAFQVYAIYDLIANKKKKTKNLSFAAWLLIIIFGEVVGAALYFVLGRSEE